MNLKIKNTNKYLAIVVFIWPLIALALYTYNLYLLLLVFSVLGMYLALVLLYKKYSDTSHKLNTKHSSNRFERLSNLTFEGILLHKNGKILDANKAFCNIIGYCNDELTGGKITDYFIVDKYKTEFSNKIALDHAFPFEIEVQTKRGRIIPIEVESVKYQIDGEDIFSTAFRNISDRRKAEATIEKVQRKLNMHFDHTPLAVIEWNLDFKVVRWNKSAERIFGYSLDEVVGVQSKFLLPENERKSVAKIWLQLKNFKTGVKSTNTNITKDGRIITCTWYNTPLLDKDGKLIGVASMAHDITKLKQLETERNNYIAKVEQKNNELKAAEEEIRAYNEELLASNQALHSNMLEREKAIKKAEENEKLKSAFLANMSHEIRTPLNGVIGFSQLLNNPDLTDNKRQDFIDIIYTSSQQLLSLVNDILDISKIETHQMKIKKESFDIHSFLDELEQLFKLKHSNSQVEIIFNNYIKNSDNFIISDKLRLIQILGNIIENAIKFTEQGFVKVSTEINNNEIIFTIEDTGIGIKKENHKKIFKRFQQIEGTKKEVASGAGLGLAISKGFVELLNGKIWLQSEPNKGTKFTVTIPNIKEEVINSSNSIKRHTSNNKFEFKILVVEDIESNFKLLVEFFDKTKATIIHAKNGQEAINICTSSNDIDLVLMDLRMPVVDGYEATRKIKKLIPDIPIIAQTAFALENEKQKALEVGCVDIVSKPINKNKLFKIIKKQFAESIV